MPITHDLLIVGGGPVGSALALSLRDSGLSVLLLEARGSAPADRRSIALSHGSRLILERLGVWPRVVPATAIETIHVSQRGRFGRALLTAVQAGVPALGYVAPYNAVHAALSGQLATDCGNLSVLRNAQVLRVEAGQDCAMADCTTSAGATRVQARLVAIADGGPLAAAAAHQRTREYAQCAVVADVQTDLPHGHRAYERFTPGGPIALLPAAAGFALVWTTSRADAERLCALADEAFLGALQTAFGDRAGRFMSASERTSYPLALRVAGAPHVHHVVLLGNAAQTLHPVAGQGLNLGLRDASMLAGALLAASYPFDGERIIESFLAARRDDRQSTIRITDTLVKLFSNDIAALAWLRGCGLTLLDILPPAKLALTGRMMFGG